MRKKQSNAIASEEVKPIRQVRSRSRASRAMKPTEQLPGSISSEEAIGKIRYHHRARRFAIKLQQKVDRSLESFIRLNATDWRPDMDEVARKKRNAEVKKIINSIREGSPHEFAYAVTIADKAREPADETRKNAEALMKKYAVLLPIYPWIKEQHGAGELGLATIVAEAGDLSNYPSPGHLWSRLGFAPYDGCAGSTWKRETWRPRKLTKEEWTDHPFSGERYALIHQIAVWLLNAQWIGKAKTESGEGEPDGPWGEEYAARRKHCVETHPDWTDGHRHKDALRIMMQEFLKALLLEWRKLQGLPLSKPWSYQEAAE